MQHGTIPRIRRFLSIYQTIFFSFEPVRRLRAKFPKAVQDGDGDSTERFSDLRSVAWLTFKVRRVAIQ